MQCVVTTAVSTDTYKELTSITVPTNSGMVQIKAGHAEYFSAVVAGELLFTNESNKTVKLAVNEGICYVLNDVVTIVA